MPDAAATLYQRLGLEPTASDDEIRRAWRRLAKEWHPDRNPNDPQAEAHFKSLHEAYRILSDPAERARYDAQLKARTGGTGGAGSRNRSSASPGFRPGGSRSGTSSTGSPSGSNSQEQAGKPGAGSQRETGPRPEHPRPQPGQDLRRHLPLPLDRFEGGGNFRVELGSQPALDLKLPGRIIPGDELVLPGLGLPGRQGGAPGRLILVLQAQLPPHVRLEGSDLHMDLVVDALLLMTGGALSVRTPKGRSLDIKLPAGSRPGQRIRLRGQGLPAAQGMGDVVLELEAGIRAVNGFRARRLADKLRQLLDEDDE